MKAKIITAALLLTASLLCAQLVDPFQALRHSSRCEDGYLRLRWQDQLGLGTDTQCWYSADGASWQLAPSGVYAEQQMQALLPYEFGQNLRYRLRTELDLGEGSIAYMHTPFLDANLFPPQEGRLGQIGTDATGDSVTVYSPNLDLTQSLFGATQTQLISALANVSGSFPTINNVYSYNVYLTTLTSPDALADSISYAMVWSFYIEGVVQPGLYKLKAGTSGIPSLTHIGNIQSMVMGGKLFMACDLDDLTGDPDFGAWPNAQNVLGVTSLTMNLSLDPDSLQTSFGIGDYSTPGFLFFADHRYEVSENSLPQCDNFALDEISQVLSFDYWDAEADFPLLMELELPEGQILEPLPLSLDYGQSVSYTVQLDQTPDFVILRFSDNAGDPVEQVHWFVGVQDEALPPAAFNCRLPNPLRSGAGPVRIDLSGLTKEPLEISVFNLRGQNLGTLFSGCPAFGVLDITWNAAMNGKALGSGMYILRLAQGGRTFSHRFVITK